jgi:spore photoproduct lyase
MYRMSPPAVFVHRRVYKNRNAVKRMERMLAAMGDPPVAEVAAADTDAIVERAGIGAACPVQHHDLMNGFLKPQADPVIVFNTFVWDEAGREPQPGPFRYDIANRLARLMAGAGEDFCFSRRELIDPQRGFVCQGGWGLHSLNGCMHRCAYCDQAFIMSILLDVEDFADHVAAALKARPQQKIWRYDMYSDQISLEPEYGASQILADVFARTSDQHLLFYTKSDNVDHLLTLRNRAHCIFYNTLSTENAARIWEPGAPPLAQRIEALRKCRDAGYPLRTGFSPIIPIRGWREEAKDAIERLFAAVEPETVRLWTASITRFPVAEAAWDMDRMDPRLVDMARRADPADVGDWYGPFPREARAEIYAHYIDEIRRVSPRTPVSLCSEEPAVWNMLAPKLRMQPDRLFCCCGGTSLPRRAPAAVRRQNSPHGKGRPG